MRLRAFLFLLILGLFALSGLASANEAGFTYAPDVLYPGKTERISFSVPHDTSVTLEVLDASGALAQSIRAGMNVTAGIVNLFYNGCNAAGQPLPEGNYSLCLQFDDKMFLSSLTIGREAPQITRVETSAQTLYFGERWEMTAHCTMPGTFKAEILLPDGTFHLLAAIPANKGENHITWDGRVNGAYLAPGTYNVYLTLTDESGFSGNQRIVSLTMDFAPTPTPIPTPTPKPVIRPSKDVEVSTPGDFWSMEVGNLDWDAIWEVMIEPITIINGRDQRETYKLRLTPDDSSARENIVGEVVFESQGVRVLETLDNGWTYIETYNASYGPDNYSSIRGNRGYGETDELIRGYVRTNLLEVITPSTEYGLLIDKMEQTLYILTKDGLFTTLMLSTGYPTKDQPWNETVAGEYFLCSKVGDFNSGNLICGYGMRIAGGCLLHEVPYIFNEKYEIKDYSSTERYLGEKASHGCVRVQRKKNNDGINMAWIWNNIPLKTKVLIWDDSDRPVEYPDEETQLYYNPDGGQYYHDDQRCSSIRDRYLPLKGQFTYGELDDADYARFTPCTHCDPPPRKAEIDKINRENGF